MASRTAPRSRSLLLLLVTFLLVGYISNVSRFASAQTSTQQLRVGMVVESDPASGPPDFFTLNALDGCTFFNERMLDEPIVLEDGRRFSLMLDCGTAPNLPALIGAYAGMIQSGAYIGYAMPPTFTATFALSALLESAQQMYVMGVGEPTLLEATLYSFALLGDSVTALEETLLAYRVEQASSVLVLSQESSPAFAAVQQASAAVIHDLGMSYVAGLTVADLEYLNGTESSGLAPAALSNYTLTVEQMTAWDADVAVCLARPPICRAILSLMQQAGYPSRGFLILANTGADSAQPDHAFVSYAANWSPAAKYPGDRYFGTPAQFSVDFQQRFGYAPNDVAVWSVTFGLLYRAAFQSAASLPSADGGMPTSDQLLFTFARLQLETVYGPIRFGVTGMNQSPTLLLQQLPVPSSLTAGDRLSAIYQDQHRPTLFNLSVVYPPRAASLDPVFPLPSYEQRHSNTGYFDSTSVIVVFTLNLVCVGYAAAWMVVIAIFRERDPIRYGTPEFLLVMLFGVVVMCGAVFAWPLNPTGAGCQAFVWLLTLGFCMFLGALLTKNYRVLKIWTNSNLLRTYSFSVLEVAVIWGLTLLPPLVVLCIMQGVSPIESEREVPDLWYPSEDYTYCNLPDTGSVVMAALLIAYGYILLIVGVVMSVKTWKIDVDLFNEAIWLAFSVYCVLVLGTIALALQASSAVDSEVLYVIRSLCIMGGGVLAVSFVMIPKCSYLLKKKTITGGSATTMSRKKVGTRASTVGSSLPSSSRSGPSENDMA
mmetsp:Transcript_4546/g.11261  ORF Transcript_4546/g.11261 Transcript_4546/m.11261 type:complete len:766 (-) Transcript_4546:46-2343(-)